MSWRTIGRLVAWLVVLAALVVVTPVLWLKTIDEAGVPPASDAPPLPAGVTVADGEIRCGSGGCYRLMRLHGSAAQTPAELVESTGLRHQTCGARGLLDRRHVCSHVEDLADGVYLIVQFDRSAWF